MAQTDFFELHNCNLNGIGRAWQHFHKMVAWTKESWRFQCRRSERPRFFYPKYFRHAEDKVRRLAVLADGHTFQSDTISLFVPRFLQAHLHRHAAWPLLLLL